MKHTPKFSPVSVYRKDGDFLTNNILFVAYVVLVSLISAYVLGGIYNNSLASMLDESSKELSESIQKFKNNNANLNIDKKDLKKAETEYFGFKNILDESSVSWSSLIARLEAIIPADVRLTKINVQPGRDLSLKLEGETTDVKQLTDFLRVLNKDEFICDPILKRHRNIIDRKDNTSKGVSFYIEAAFRERGASL